MISKFFAALITTVSEELLMDIFRAVVREVLLKGNKESLAKAVDQIELAVADVQAAGGNEDEEIKRLIDAGRVAVARVRDRK